MTANNKDGLNQEYIVARAFYQIGNVRRLPGVSATLWNANNSLQQIAVKIKVSKLIYRVE
jgi:hypothetical protein